MLVYWRVPLPKKSHIQIQWSFFCGTMSGSKISQMIRSESSFWWTTFNDDVKEIEKLQITAFNFSTKTQWFDDTAPQMVKSWCSTHGEIHLKRFNASKMLGKYRAYRKDLDLPRKSIKTTTHVLVWSSKNGQFKSLPFDLQDGLDWPWEPCHGRSGCQHMNMPSLRGLLQGGVSNPQTHHPVEYSEPLCSGAT